MPKLSDLTIRNAEIRYLNFAGKEGPFNEAGDRNFAVVIDDHELAEDLKKDGWNIKPFKKREPEDPDKFYIPVAVSFKVKPPVIEMIVEPRRGVKVRQPLEEDLVELIDVADIAKVDLTLNPFRWSVGQKTGVKAYLKAFFVTIASNELVLEYAELPTVEEFRALRQGESENRELPVGERPNIIQGEVLSSSIIDDDTMRELMNKPDPTEEEQMQMLDYADAMGTIDNPRGRR
jgi:hypothetical protein